MNKRAIIIGSSIITVIIIGGLIYFIFRFQENKNIKSQINNISNNTSMEIINKIAVETSNEEEQRVSPNSKIILKQYYKICGHTVEEEYNVPEDVVNMSKNEITEYYSDWVLDEFSNEEIKIHRNNDGKCNEHYIAKDTNGYIVIYNIDAENNENIVKRTDILTKYLTTEDQEKLKNGIIITGKEDLNLFLEDFE